MPVGVSRTVTSAGNFTEREWERLVVDLRETFDAKGAVKREGSFRQWTNGNLQALVEPTASRSSRSNAYNERQSRSP